MDPPAWLSLLPPSVAIVTAFFSPWCFWGLHVTGGDGSTAIFWAMTLYVVSAGAMYVWQEIFTAQEAIEVAMRGIGGLVSVLLLTGLAFSLGATTRELEAGTYLAA